jgi:hypothetical protein
MIHGHVEWPGARARRLDEIGEVEVAGRQPHDPHRRVGHDQITDPEAAEQERGEVEASFQPAEVGERRRLVTLGEAEPAHREASRQQIELDSLDADRAARDRMDPGDRDTADDLRQLIHRDGAADQDETKKQSEPTTTRAHDTVVLHLSCRRPANIPVTREHRAQRRSYKAVLSGTAVAA